MAGSVLAATSPQLTSWRWRPLLAAHPRASPPPARRLRALASPLRTPIPRNPCSGATVARTPCAAAVSFGAKAEVTEREREAPDWDVPKRVALFALGCCAAAAVLGCGAARAAAEDSIKASGFGLRVAESLRRLGWPDDAVVFALATLPVIELRGAIPVGYWMRLHPVRLTVLSVLGNMVPVSFIILYLRKLATYLSQRSASATRLIDLLFERARRKAAPVEEFQWLGLMLFVAVPFPGTGAWTGAIIASVLGMPFWSGFSANFVGVILAGLLVNMLMNLGLKYAITTGVFLFLVSTVMWNVLRSLKKSVNAK
ncbi:uncharacterized protein C2845_PM02G44680 [Panicum miliaceum]|uniref:Small multi-drug export protein n=1 Tax=Panicum miliaceum TaxID=4540 RepID=A0A3L6S8R7_PANMI|nr:uncharacterized protein C2845_PM02G44680 [Panicum miliaceum]